MRAASRAGAIAIMALLAVAAAGTVTFVKLVRLDRNAEARWTQVEYAYRRRAALVPDVVGAAGGVDVNAAVDARRRVGELEVPTRITADRDAFARFERAQDELDAALTGLLAAADADPRAAESMREVRARLAGADSRIAFERMRYNEAARAFNAGRAKLGTSLVAAMFGDRFDEKRYFTVTATGW